MQKFHSSSTLSCFFLLSSPFSVARITRSTMHSELILSTQLHILTDKFFVTCRIMNLDVVSCGGDD